MAGILPRSRLHWPRGLTCGSAAARLLGLLLRIPPGTCLSLVSVVCCMLEVSAMGRSLVRRSLTECGVSKCDLPTSVMRGTRPNGAVQPCRVTLKRRKDGSKDKGPNIRRPSQVVVTMRKPTF
jgi:hypothetical protein